nr:coiled-coil-helix-coiled-coil-helix domain-containing protein 5 isoform X2 [Cavia porcellus]
MQVALEITARYCGRELDQYGQCVAAKPESWQRDCHYLKMSIARCTSAHPIIRQIRQDCAEPFEAFEECLRRNETAVGNCAELSHFLPPEDSFGFRKTGHKGLAS